MKQHLRESGVFPLGRVPWGTHVCVFYADASEIAEVLVPYFATGLRSRERCLWVCSPPLGIDEARRILVASDLAGCLESGQMQLEDCRRWYLRPDGAFDGDAVLERWKKKIDEALASGYEGIRAAGDVSWMEPELWRSFCDYEGRLFGAIARVPMLAMCLYPLEGVRAPQTVDIARTHQYALLRRESGWELAECARRWEVEWESLFDALSDGLLLVDVCGKILAANSACLEILKAPSVDEMGACLSDMEARFEFRAVDAIPPCPLTEVLSGRSDVAQSWRAISMDKERLDLVVRARQIETRSPFLSRYLVVLQDVTEVRAADRARDEFIQIVSHELRNPLQTMKAVLQLAESGPASDSPGLARYLKALGGQVDHISLLVEDLLTVCRIDRGGLAVSLRETDITALVEETVESFATLSGREIIPVFSREKPVTAWADEVRTKQVLANLLGNAVKYTPDPGRIWIDVEMLPNSVVVKVADEGIGIPPEETSDVFRAFYRASNSRDRSREGAGLGLYISRHLARLQGGDLWVEQRPGGGTVMSLRLPSSRT